MLGRMHLCQTPSRALLTRFQVFALLFIDLARMGCFAVGADNLIIMLGRMLIPGRLFPLSSFFPHGNTSPIRHQFRQDHLPVGVKVP